MLEIIGLTENGVERISKDKLKDYGLSNGEYYDASGFAMIFLRQEAGTFLTSELSIDDKKEIIQRSKLSKLGDLEGEKDGDYCYAGSGHCDTITEENYKKVAKKYGFSLNPKTVFDSISQDYKTKVYLMVQSAYITILNKVYDSLEFDAKDDEAYIIYDFTFDPVSSDVNSKRMSKKITFIFKQDEDKKYNLYKMNVVNK